jgi:putative ABC transport system ATP-binding protein/lipoprotein-releasing system ATP-binding protein
LLYTLAGLERPQAGRVGIDGQDLYQLSLRAQSRLRNSMMGYVFQNYYLLPELTALENVMVPGMIAGKDPRGRATELLDRVGLLDRIHHLPAELSGGEQQRVAIARALVNDPAMVFADEPTGNLDSRNGEEVMSLLLGFAAHGETTLVVVTHDSGLATRGDRTLEIVDGKMV